MKLTSQIILWASCTQKNLAVGVVRKRVGTMLVCGINAYALTHTNVHICEALSPLKLQLAIFL